MGKSNWYSEQLKSARKEIAQWPQWMRDEANNRNVRPSKETLRGISNNQSLTNKAI